jgi:hypothetical protein
VEDLEKGDGDGGKEGRRGKLFSSSLSLVVVVLIQRHQDPLAFSEALRNGTHTTKQKERKKKGKKEAKEKLYFYTWLPLLLQVSWRERGSH